jgi:4-amino-4-deoxy-L-arabinose transferase-like glycosyltransferase
MEAATLRRSGPAALAQQARAALEERSRVFWIVVGLTALGALLRFATLGLQSYHHDEVVTASRVLQPDFFQTMDVVGYSESAPPLYYALAWFWTQFTGTGEFGLRSLSALLGTATIPVAFLLGAELRGRRTGLLAAALVAVNPMLLWYSQEARAYALLTLLCALSLLFCLRALRNGQRRDFVLWGVASGLALATHYFAVFPLLVEAVLLARQRRRASWVGLGIAGCFGALLLPLAISQMSYGHAEWIGNVTLGHRLWETAATFVTGETADIIGQPEKPALSFVPLALCLAAFALLLWRGGRAERRSALRPLAVGAAAIGVPVFLALFPGGKDFVLARNMMAALVPLLLVVAVGLTLPSARRIGNVLAAALLAYSLGFCIYASFSPDLQRPDWGAVASRLGEADAPRATVTWTLGLAPLRYELNDDAFMVKPAERLDWQVREIAFVSEGKAPPPPRRMLGPGFRESGRAQDGHLFIRRYRQTRPGLAPLRLRQLRGAPLDFRTNGVLLDGVGPG